MKKIFLFLLAALFAAELSAQELTVKSFELRETDLRAKTKPRNDKNGEPCAMLAVQIAAPNCKFSGDFMVGEAEQGFGEYLIYMAKGARKIRIVHPDYLFLPLEFSFPSPLESMCAYSLILEVPIYTHYAEIVEQQAKNNSAQPTGQPLTKPTTQPTKPAEKVYKVGDYYNENGKEGVVFWVDETGKHGKIVSMKESTTKMQWSDDYEEKRRIGANSQTDGAKNMAVVKQISDWQSKYPAFKWCADLGEGWYLPAIEELRTFTMDNELRNTINHTLAMHNGMQLANKSAWKLHLYWSSSEKEGSGKKIEVYYISMDARGVRSYMKTFSFPHVRAVAAF